MCVYHLFYFPKQILILYNLLCSILSLYTMLGYAKGLFQCEHIFQKEPVSILKPYFFMYWLTKNIELLDTVFMVLRHRRRQISFLHVYHHATMLLLSDYANHVTPWPAIAVFLAINSLVHVFLYSYYFVTVLYPSSTPGWKQRLTEFQILQFFVDFIFAGIGYLHHGFCIYGLLYGIMMTALFSNFYYHTYLKNTQSSKKSL